LSRRYCARRATGGARSRDAARDRALTAPAVQRDLVPLNREAARRQPGQIAGAVVHVEHPLAGGALKVMMVAVADGLGRLARRRDRLLRRLAAGSRRTC
jgi:hypothetical protein